MMAMSRLSVRHLAPLILAFSVSYFVIAASRQIAIPGLQYDEVLFVNAATGERTNGLFIVKRVLGIPVMLMGYVGALKAYLYFPVFQLWGVSPATIRWPVIIVSSLSLGLAFAVARFAFGPLVSALLVLVIAVDPALTYMTKLDHGPAVLMILLKLAALFFLLKTVSDRSARHLWLLVIACILGTFDKLNFIWFVLALGTASVLLFRAELVAAYRNDRRGFVLPLAALVLVAVVATSRLIAPQFLSTQEAAREHSLADRIPYLVEQFSRTMNGKALFLFTTKQELGSGSLTNVVTAAALVVLIVAGALAWRRAGGLGRIPFAGRVIGCHLILFTAIGFQIWITKKAWAPHHMMMLYPFHHFLAMGAATAVAPRVGVALVAAVLVGSGINVGMEYARAFRPTEEFSSQWSPVIYDLASYLDRREVDRIVSVDWGTHNQVYALGNSRTRKVSRDRWPDFKVLGEARKQREVYQRDFENREVLVLLHAPEGDVLPGVRAHFAAWARTLGLKPALEKTFTSQGGREIFEVYYLDDRAGAQPTSSPRSSQRGRSRTGPDRARSASDSGWSREEPPGRGRRAVLLLERADSLQMGGRA